MLVYYFFISILGEWFVYNSFYHNFVIEELLNLKNQGLLTDTIKDRYFNVLFVVERVFDLVLFLPFCFLLFKLKISRMALTVLVALGFIISHFFVYSTYVGGFNTKFIISMVWSFTFSCGLVNVNQLFGIKNKVAE